MLLGRSRGLALQTDLQEGLRGDALKSRQVCVKGIVGCLMKDQVVMDMVFCLSYSDVCFDAVEGDIDGISCCKCVSFLYTNTLQLETN